MKKLVAVLFGLLVVAAGFAVATTWETTRVEDWDFGAYAKSYAYVDVKYDISRPYTNYIILRKDGFGDLYPMYQRQMLLTGNPYILVQKEYTYNGITVRTRVYFDLVKVETVVASAGWPTT